MFIAKNLKFHVFCSFENKIYTTSLIAFAHVYALSTKKVVAVWQVFFTAKESRFECILTLSAVKSFPLKDEVHMVAAVAAHIYCDTCAATLTAASFTS